MKLFRAGKMTDARLAILVFVLAAIAGWLYMTLCIGVTGPQYDVKGPMMLPAILWATGHGFSDTPYKLCSPLDDFLEQRALSLDPQAVPKWMPTTSVIGQKFKNDRLYLYYAAGLTWRLLGIKWASLNVFIALVYAIMAVLIYAIFRLGMGRLISFLGMLLAMSSPLMLRLLPSIRDLCKGPFILATILLVGYLASRPIRLRRLLMLSIGLGLAIGIGVGFRQDSIICAPPALAAILFLAHGNARFRLLARLAACALFLVAFLVPAWPVISMTRETGGNNSFYLLQGFALTSQEDLGMRRSSLAPLATGSDALVHATICAFDRAYPTPESDFWGQQRRGASSMYFLHGLVNLAVEPVSAVPRFVVATLLSQDDLYLGIWSKDAEEVTRRFVRMLAATFPADVISRWYGAATYVLRGPQGDASASTAYNSVLKIMYGAQMPIERHLRTYGDFYALAALLLLSARSVWLALVSLCLIVYFCGYTSLCFQPRHAFHLEFFSFWMPAFCLQCIIGAAMAWRDKDRRRAFFSGRAASRAWMMPLKRMGMFLLISALLLSTPLVLARIWQHRQVHQLLSVYEHAQLEPVAVDKTTDTDNTACYHPSHVLELSQTEDARWWWKLAGVPTERIPGLITDFLVAEFEMPLNCREALLHVVTDDPIHRFDYFDKYDVDSGSVPLQGQAFTFRYFFPVFRFLSFEPPTHFSGIASELRLKNLYRVKNPRDFPLLMNLWLFDEPIPFRWYEALPIFGGFV